MRVPLMLTTAVGWSLCSGIAAAQTPAHVDAVKNAQKSAYAVVESTNGCPAADRDLFGWPRNLVLNCEYAKQDTALGRKRRAVAYLLDVKPEVIARWIEGACAELRNEPANCSRRCCPPARATPATCSRSRATSSRTWTSRECSRTSSSATA